MYSGRWRDEIDTELSPENDEASVMDSLDGVEREDLLALSNRVSHICSHREDPLLRQLEDESLSDDERAIMEQYDDLQTKARERMHGDIFVRRQ